MELTPQPQPDLHRLELTLDLLTNGRQLPEMYLQGLLDKEVADKDAIPHTTDAVLKANFSELGNNLVGMGIGPKNSEGNSIDELSIKFYVKEKLPRKSIGEKAVPSLLELPGIGEFLTDVEEIGPVWLEALNTRLRPAQAGYSIGHTNTKGGSIGCLVHERNDPSRVFVLSNSHVIANSGIAKHGDSIIQPCAVDGGTASDEVAKLADWVKFDFSPRFSNGIDAAIAGPVTNAEFESTIALLNIVPRGVNQNLRVGMKVKKVGRTSDLTTGVIRDVHFRTEFSYPNPSGGRGVVRFLNQVLCTNFTSYGDSGALVLDEDNYGLGLHFAGSPRASIFSPISYALDGLNIELVTYQF